MSENVRIRLLPSGVPGLDDVLGGGIPEFSFNVIAGGPGCGKTTVGHQILFANASPSRRGLYISVLGEPPIKMLRYQQQYRFFDASRVGDAIRFLHLGEEALNGGLGAVLDAITREVEATSPALVVVDSFRSVVRRLAAGGGTDLDLESFMQRLAIHLTSCEATTFLLGEYLEQERDANSAVFTVADGILWLSQATDRNSIVRKLQVVKMRGQGQIPGLHTARIDDGGLQVFPRLLKPEDAPQECDRTQRLSTGIAGLDEMLGGGVPRGYSVLVAGPSGSGKTVLANQFILEGLRVGEPGIIAVFEKRPNDYLATSPQGGEFRRLATEQKLEILYLRPLDLSLDETLLAMREAVKRIGARRAVIDSLSGLELALAPTFRDDFRESLYRMIGALTMLDVTVMSTVEVEDMYDRLHFSAHGVAFLTDAIIMQRYVEIGGELRRAMGVVKVRASDHSHDLREYRIDKTSSVIVGEPLSRFEGVLSGTPRVRGEGPWTANPTKAT